MEVIITLESLFAIGVIGAVVSIGVQWLKNKFGIGSNKTKLITIGVSIVIATVWYFFATSDWFINTVGILATASTVWALILKKAE